MASLPKAFQAQSNAIASYSYTDIAEGTGVTAFYLGTAQVSGSSTYHLTTNPIYSTSGGGDWSLAGIESTANVSNRAVVGKDLDIDFDVEFNKPKTILGTAILNLGFTSVYGSGNPLEAWVIAKIRKYSGTTESEIASATSPHVVTDESSDAILTLPIELTQTHFKSGDILRLTIEVYQKSDDGETATNGNSYVGHDPQNRDGTIITPSSDDNNLTASVLYMPFRLDEIGY